jgi:hypothetical protein
MGNCWGAGNISKLAFRTASSFVLGLFSSKRFINAE